MQRRDSAFVTTTPKLFSTTRAVFVAMSAAVALFSIVAEAQIDPSSALLLNRGGRPAKRDTGVDSGRYTVKPKSDASSKRDDTRLPKRTSTDHVGQPAQVATPVNAPTEGEQPDSAEPSYSSPQQTPVSDVATPGASGGKTSDTKASDVSQAERVDKSERVDQSQEEGDRRLNLLEISLAPGYLYNDSSSDLYYRSYHTSAPTLAVEANVWFTPQYSLHAGYLGTINGHVSDSVDGSKNVAANQRWFTIGARSRRFFGASRLAPALTFGLDYMEYQFQVPSDSVLRSKLDTYGLQLSLEADLPATANRSWTLGLTFAPKLKHTESVTGIDFQSGDGVEASSIGFSVGGQFSFDRSHTMFWKINHAVEKDLFTGEASVANPLTGVRPAGVQTTNSFTNVQFGYTWGN